MTLNTPTPDKYSSASAVVYGVVLWECGIRYSEWIATEGSVQNDWLDTGVQLQQSAAATARYIITRWWPVDAQPSPLFIPVYKRRPTPGQMSSLPHCCCDDLRAAIRGLFVAVCEPASPAARSAVNRRRWRQPTTERLIVACRLREGHLDSERVPVAGKSSTATSAQLQQLVPHCDHNMPVFITSIT